MYAKGSLENRISANHVNYQRRYFPKFTGILFHVWFAFLKFSFERLATAPRHTGWKGTELHKNYCRTNGPCSHYVIGSWLTSSQCLPWLPWSCSWLQESAAGGGGGAAAASTWTWLPTLTTPSRGDGVALYWERVRSVACARPGPAVLGCLLITSGSISNTAQVTPLQGGGGWGARVKWRPGTMTS